MKILEELIAPMSLPDFIKYHYMKAPLASPNRAQRFEDLISWPLLLDILKKEHGDCWLAENGYLSEDPRLSTGYLKAEQAMDGFNSGKTLLIRHSERAHSQIQKIANDFYEIFGLPVDVQIYATPANHEGFNWHYDMEDVFVIQSRGEKEFYLKPNSVNPHPVFMPKDLEFQKEKNKTTLRCWLKPGDWLYIPKGYWHKARALTDSFHLSVGVLNNLPKNLVQAIFV